MTCTPHGRGPGRPCPESAGRGFYTTVDEIPKMVRTAGSIFSPDTSGPLKRRVRRKYATGTLVKVERASVGTTPNWELRWYFDQNITLLAAPVPELKCKGVPPSSTIQFKPNALVCAYSTITSVDDPWSIDTEPTNIQSATPIKLPQSGLVTLGV